MNFFSRLKEGLGKTRRRLRPSSGCGPNSTTISSKSWKRRSSPPISGLILSLSVIERLKQEIKTRRLRTVDEAYAALKELVAAELSITESEPRRIAKPWVVLVVGVNGVGKTNDHR